MKDFKAGEDLKSPLMNLGEGAEFDKIKAGVMINNNKQLGHRNQ